MEKTLLPVGLAKEELCARVKPSSSVLEIPGRKSFLRSRLPNRFPQKTTKSLPTLPTS